ncbi:MAG: hypothetical protein WAR76_06705 [Xanthobacteraceae bacterium]
MLFGIRVAHPQQKQSCFGPQTLSGVVAFELSNRMKNPDQWTAHDPAEFVPQQRTLYNPHDYISPKELSAQGIITPELYFCWQTPKTRDIVLWAMKRITPA